MRKWMTLMTGQEWKDIRSSVTPAFTSGKIKQVSKDKQIARGNVIIHLVIF
jgi:cytochrome P450